MEAFNSVKPVSVRQEFFATMYLSNLAAIIELEADSKIAASAGNRHDYQTNRSYILDWVKSCIIRLLQSSLCVCSKIICRMVEEFSKKFRLPGLAENLADTENIHAGDIITI